jgi:hypothetical protein
MQGIRTGQVPFELWSGGQTFWQHLEANPRHAATFDAGMHEVNQFGGTAVAVNYPWSKFDCVVDVAGGVGGFLAEIVRRNSKLQGVLFDQPASIGRAETVRRIYRSFCTCTCVAAKHPQSSDDVCKAKANDMLLQHTCNTAPGQHGCCWLLDNTINCAIQVLD